MKLHACLALIIFLFSGLADESSLRRSGNPERPEPVFDASPRLQQVAVTVTDLPRAIGFYRDTLGLPMLMETNGMAFFNLGDIRLMLGADDQRPKVDRPTAVIYFDAPNFHSAVSKLEARGVNFVAPVETVTRTANGALMLAEFRDPDGNALAVMGEVSISPRAADDDL